MRNFPDGSKKGVEVVYVPGESPLKPGPKPTTQPKPGMACFTLPLILSTCIVGTRCFWQELVIKGCTYPAS